MSNEFASFVLLVGTAVALAFAAIAWRRRPAIGAQALMVLLLLGALWTSSNAIMLVSNAFETKLLWLNVQLIAMSLMGPTWFLFAAKYPPRNGWMSRRVAIVVYLPALFLALLVWTNPWHGWVLQNPRMEMLRGLPYLNYEWGVGRLSILLYSYGVILTGILLFVQKFSRSLYMHRRVSRYFIISCIVALAFDALTMVSPRLAPNFDASSLVLITIGAFLVITAIRRDVWDMMPFSRREILHNMHDGILLLNNRNQIISCNRAACHLMGREEEEIHGLHPQELVGWSTFELEEDPRQAQLVELQWTRITPWGEEEETLDLEVRVSPLHARGQGMQGRLMVLRDQTPQRRTERELWESEASLRAVQRVESVGYLAGEVARDFGSLLDSVNGQLTSALQSLSYKHPAARHLRTSLHDTHRAMELVNQLLAYAGSGHASVEYVDVNKVVMESRELFESIVPAGSKLDIELNAHTPLVLGNSIQVQQILLNLLMNASDAVQLDRELSTIETTGSTRQAESHIEIRVYPHHITPSKTPMGKGATHSESLAKPSANETALSKPASSQNGTHGYFPNGHRVEETHQNGGDPSGGHTEEQGQGGYSKRLDQKSRGHFSDKGAEQNSIDGGRTTEIVFDVERWFPAYQVPEPGLYTLIEVSDNGIGMSDVLQERIFEPFYSTRNGGRGLGLSAVLGVLRAHGGALQVQSQLGEGSRFFVLLPAAALEPPATSGGAPSEQRGTEFSARNPTVLAIHDKQQISVVRETGLLIETEPQWTDRLLDALQLLNTQMTWTSTLDEGLVIVDLHRAYLDFVVVRADMLQAPERLFILQEHLQRAAAHTPTLLIVAADSNDWLTTKANRSLLPSGVHLVEYDHTIALTPYAPAPAKALVSSVTGSVMSERRTAGDDSVRQLAESIRRALRQKV